DAKVAKRPLWIWDRRCSRRKLVPPPSATIEQWNDKKLDDVTGRKALSTYRILQNLRLAASLQNLCGGCGTNSCAAIPVQLDGARRSVLPLSRWQSPPECWRRCRGRSVRKRDQTGSREGPLFAARGKWQWSCASNQSCPRSELWFVLPSARHAYRRDGRA